MKKLRLTKAAAESTTAATEAGRNIWDDAAERVAVILLEVQYKAVPLAYKARERMADFASKRLDTWELHIRGALNRAPPAVDAVHEKVISGLLPNLQQVLCRAAGRRPAPVKKQKRKSGRLKKFAKFVLINSLVAGTVAAVRHFLTSKDDGRTTHELSRTYINGNDTFATAAKFNKPVAPTPQPITPIPGAPRESFGEGSCVSPNPPEGYIFKGNERSRKYHIPGTRGYELMIAEVWFNSEETAKAAGFTKAQR